MKDHVKTIIIGSPGAKRDAALAPFLADETAVILTAENEPDHLDLLRTARHEHRPVVITDWEKVFAKRLVPVSPSEDPRPDTERAADIQHNIRIREQLKIFVHMAVHQGHICVACEKQDRVLAARRDFRRLEV